MSELYQLPAGWEWKRLVEVCKKITDGAHQSPKTIDKGKPYITVRDIQGNGQIDFDGCKFISNEDFELLVKNNCKPNKGDVLLSKDGTVGKVSLVKDNTAFVVLSSLAILSPSNNLLPEFLKNYLLSPYFVEAALNSKTGAAIKRIVLKAIKEFYIPVPPLEEQERIVQKLDALFERIDKAIALLQKNIDAADNFMNSVLNDVFSALEQNYNKHSVDELCTKITDGTHSTPCYTDSGVPFLSVKDISNGVINFSNTRFISLEEHKLLSKRCNVEKNDILYTKVGTTGIAKVVDVDNEFSIFVSIALLKPKHDIIYNKFFQYMLNSPNCYSQAQKLTRGVANRNLVLKDIKGIIFPIPPYQLQQNIVTYLDGVSAQIEQVKSSQQQKMQNLLDLKSSILDQAFHGKL